MLQKIIGAGVGTLLVSLAAIGAFASQDAVTLQETDETPTVEATETPETLEPEATETPEATQEPEETDEPTETPVAEVVEEPENGDEENGDEENGEREIAGIPDHNPNFTDHEGDGDCEKGEAVIITTPSGQKVRVPCQAGRHGNPGEHGQKIADEARKRGGPPNGNGDGDGGDEE